MKDCERIVNNEVTPEELLDGEDEVHSTTPTKVVPPAKPKTAKKASVSKERLFHEKRKAKEMFATLSGKCSCILCRNYCALFNV